MSLLTYTAGSYQLVIALASLLESCHVAHLYIQYVVKTQGAMSFSHQSFHIKHTLIKPA